VSDTIFLTVTGKHLRIGFNPASCPYSWRLYEDDYNHESHPEPGVVEIDLYWTPQGYWVEQTTEFDPWNNPQYVRSWRVLDRDYALRELIKKDATIPAEVAPPEEVARLRAEAEANASHDHSGPTGVAGNGGSSPPQKDGQTTHPPAMIRATGATATGPEPVRKRSTRVKTLAELVSRFRDNRPRRPNKLADLLELVDKLTSETYQPVDISYDVIIPQCYGGKPASDAAVSGLVQRGREAIESKKLPYTISDRKKDRSVTIQKHKRRPSTRKSKQHH
jgi:hypothetical protein